MSYFGKTMSILFVIFLIVPAYSLSAEVNEEYKGVLAEWESSYTKAVNERDADSGGLSFEFYDMSDLGSAKAYYALYDIDGNGIPELILRKTSSYEDIIAYIFTIKNGKAVNIFGYYGKDFSYMEGKPREVPWSRAGSSVILSSGLIDSTDGDYAVYRIADDGYSVIKFASSEPYDYPDEASLDEAEWRYYANNKQVDYDAYVRHLNEHGYKIGGNNTRAKIDWVAVK
ncbi:MAG: hypothetical protein FWF87_04810 [Synergistaceae bacterium]|nr:hypothetical protein [Synergistaceae bacterium]